MSKLCFGSLKTGKSNTYVPLSLQVRLRSITTNLTFMQSYGKIANKQRYT